MIICLEVQVHLAVMCPLCGFRELFTYSTGHSERCEKSLCRVSSILNPSI